MNSKITVAICQMRVEADKAADLKKARRMIEESAQMGAEMVVLPEIFNGPYDTGLFAEFAETFPGPSTQFLADCARENNVLLIGGSIAEKDEYNHIYNTSFIFDQTGTLIGKHRKIHLFDIDVPGRITFKESSVLSPGNALTVINTDDLCLGVMICYDIRFPELSRAVALEGAQILVVPAAFNTTTGPAHWEITMRSRAVDNQLFVIAASPARNPEASYQAWGHSLLIDPWGNILDQADENEKILIAQLNLTEINRIRSELPLLQHRRTDIYQVSYKGK